MSKTLEHIEQMGKQHEELTLYLLNLIKSYGLNINLYRSPDGDIDVDKLMKSLKEYNLISNEKYENILQLLKWKSKKELSKNRLFFFIIRSIML